MRQYILAVAGLVAVQACQDLSNPVTEPSTGASQADSGIDLSEVQASATAAHLFAVVDINGNLVRGSRVTSVAHVGIGQYEVTFSRNLTTCAYVATTENAYSQALGIFTASGHLSANGVFIETKNQGGGLTDGPFNLVVTCGGTGIRYAVVGYSANLVRGTAGTALTQLGIGRYNLTFAASVSACSYIATVADPGNGLALAPNGVYTGSGPNSKTVYIETKNPGGGLSDGIPFHLELICSSTPNSRYTVVRKTGVKERASSGSSSARLATGSFTVSHNRTLTSCASVATRGSVNTGVPFNPATVEIVPGPNANSIGFQVRQLLFFGGNLNDQAFHTATVCS